MRGLLLAATLLVAAGCVAPAPGGAPTTPTDDGTSLLAPVPEQVTKLEPASNVEFGGGNDIAFRGRFAYVSSSSGMHIVDISDPTAAREVASVPCTGSDVGVVQTAQGLIVTISSQSSDDKCPDPQPKGGIRLVDVTDPEQPVVLSQVPLERGSHTHTPYGDTGLLYNSAYDLVNVMAHHKSEIVDISDPSAPEVVGAFAFPQDSKAPGCHDILAEPERDRAVCAGIHETMIWDTADPLAPKVVSTITLPLINIHHSAATARDGALLVLGDEYAGAIVPACHPASTVPTGALWFFDITDPRAPEMLGYFPPPADEPGMRCTAHNFNTVEGRDLVVAGFYSGGTILVDFSDPAAPKEVSRQAPPGGSAWGALYYRGAVFTGDGTRGLDVYLLK